MANSESGGRPWLLDLATEQRGAREPLQGVTYDDGAQMTYLAEPYIAVIDTDQRSQTKKADREVGEDQKL
ncbi:hypothetical protein OM076_13750 [Solirubrobacter ginsenosidimutans]|uniref:Uncharacterized protein n=1 Tax=Solirubrobacter ginsenosidimutans TaxID=490573 RepID=A0A9X3MS22_9ACTN|nr:hypothetical protein [Solirubrobacter ginsenosidimutans]MDA0161337.1 hypothetical protein [Solirubrobacter ginsenosidimutans]